MKDRLGLLVVALLILAIMVWRHHQVLRANLTETRDRLAQWEKFRSENDRVLYRYANDVWELDQLRQQTKEIHKLRGQIGELYRLRSETEQLRRRLTEREVEIHVLQSQLEQSRAMANQAQPRSNALSAQFSPDGTRILTADADGIGRVWDAATGRAPDLPFPSSTSGPSPPR